MRPLSDREHKTLLRIGSKTIISRIVDGLMENGIDRIVIGTGQPSGRPLPGVTLPKAPGTPSKSSMKRHSGFRIIRVPFTGFRLSSSRFSNK